ncbi:MAG: 4Fe-4S binding protein [Acidobacteria bacterium]|nr:4Fe-4S binding protein [Acidobacteriota bacterium]
MAAVEPGAKRSGVDLAAAIPPFGRLLRRRWFPQALALPLLALLVLFLATGWWGTPVGNRNGLVVFVWILWWFLLIAVLVPFGARAWCGVCPIPTVGEWLQRRTLFGVRAEDPRDHREGPGHRVGRNRYRGLGRRWPRRLANLWSQNLAFLGLATFSPVLLTSPLASAVAIGAMVLVATAVALVFRQRTFCRYLCPVGGFLGLYAMGSTLAVRSRNASVCADCREKSCLAGSERAWGCPWLEYPSRLERNNACGLCFECVSACPHENMSLFLRAPFSDRRLRGWDEAFKAFLMLGLALAYSVVYLGPRGELKSAARGLATGDWLGFLGFAGGLWILALLVVPGVFLGAARAGRRLAAAPVPLRDLALAGAAALVPFGLLVWIAFSVPLVLANGSYVVAAASDPFGRGWDLFGTSALGWTPVVPHWTPWIQAVLVLAGQAAGLRAGWLETLATVADRRRAIAAFAPTAGALGATALLFLALFVG